MRSRRRRLRGVAHRPWRGRPPPSGGGPRSLPSAVAPLRLRPRHHLRAPRPPRWPNGPLRPPDRPRPRVRGPPPPPRASRRQQGREGKLRCRPTRSERPRLPRRSPGRRRRPRRKPARQRRPRPLRPRRLRPPHHQAPPPRSTRRPSTASWRSSSARASTAGSPRGGLGRPPWWPHERSLRASLAGRTRAEPMPVRENGTVAFAAEKLVDWRTATLVGRKVAGAGGPLTPVQRARLTEDFAEVVPEA